MTTRPRSPTTGADEEPSAAKRAKVDNDNNDGDTAAASSASSTTAAQGKKAKQPKMYAAPTGPMALDSAPSLESVLAQRPKPPRVDFTSGLFLAPMVRSGALPTRLISLQYGATLVWGPEIVDRALMGCERKVNEKTGIISWSKEEDKEIYTSHPIERPYHIFQLGSANPAWAYDAIKIITAHDDVAGVDLNCGCPKSFSTIGGMGAHLLHTPDILCDVLRAMRRAAPPHVTVSCKIRLLPTKEATQALVRQIIRTGCIDNLTVHCRTKEMRSTTPALLERLEEVAEVVREETGGALPLCCNGDAWDYDEAQRIMALNNVKSIMIARGAEANPSCFRPEGPLSAYSVIAPQWARYAAAFNQGYGIAKFCMSQLALKASSSFNPKAKALPGELGKKKMASVRADMSAAKNIDDMAKIFGVDAERVREMPMEEVLRPLREALDKRESGKTAAAAAPATDGAEAKAEVAASASEVREDAQNVAQNRVEANEAIQDVATSAAPLDAEISQERPAAVA